MKGTMNKRINIVRTISTFLLIVAMMFGMIASTPKKVAAGDIDHVSQSMAYSAAKAVTCTHPGTSVTTKVITAPTCTQSGTYARVCNKCGTVLTRYSVDKLGHDHRIVDNGSSITVKCCHNGCSSTVTPKTLAEFAKYYEGQGKALSSYSSDIQNKIKAYWLRYLSPTSNLNQDAALKIVKHSSSVKLFSKIATKKNDKAVADYLYAINKLSNASFKKTEGIIFKKTTTVYPFSCLTQASGAIIGNGFSAFLSLNQDIRNSPDYKIFKLVINGLSKLGGGASVSYFTKVIDQYAKITNALLTLSYQGAGQVAHTYVAAFYDNKSLKDIADHLDSYYDDCVNPYTSSKMKFGDGYSKNPTAHDEFIKYILKRAHDDFESIFGVDLESLKGY